MARAVGIEQFDSSAVFMSNSCDSTIG